MSEEPRRQHPVTSAGPEGATGPAQVAALARRLATGVVPRAVVLVEGISDQGALEALAERQGRDLGAEATAVVPIGGATNIGRFLDLLGPRGYDVRLAGLCDIAEEGHVRRALERSNLGSSLTRPEMERLGFYVCVVDLEDELIRSLGADAVERIVMEKGRFGSFPTYQKQPAHRGRPLEEQLRGFMSNWKGHYARLLVDALDLARVPKPLHRVLDHVAPG